MFFDIVIYIFDILQDGEICSVPDNPDNTADEISGPATQSLSEAVVQVIFNSCSMFTST